LQNAGGFGNAGAIFAGGTITSATASHNSITAAAATNLTLAGGAGNSSILLTPQGTGQVYTSKFAVQSTSSASRLSLDVADATTTLGPVNSLEVFNSNATVNNISGLLLGQSSSVYAAIAAVHSSRTGGARSIELDFWSAIGNTPTQRMRLASSGNLLIGGTTDSSNGRLQLATHTTSAGGIGFGTDTTLFRSAAGTLSVGATTASTSTTTGSLVNAGGFGNAGAAFIGGNATVFGAAGITINNVGGSGNDSILTLTQSGVSNAFIKNTATTGDIAIGDGGGTYLRITKGAGVVFVSNTTASSSTTTGSLVNAGGFGCAGAAYFGGAIAIGNTVNTVSPTSPNRTVTIVIGGTTYYLHAKTTND
jgi:hypothetical protein